MAGKTKILLSFVGTNDAGKLIGNTDGAILTALQNESFNEVILLWNEAKIGSAKYSDIVEYLKKEIKKRKLAAKVTDHKFNLIDVTDHNEIYDKVKNYTDALDKSPSKKYTVAISSGTPAMQVVWILLAESGDFSIDNQLRLIKTKDPKFGKSKNIVVQLDTGLPRIIGLTQELAEVKQDLIPEATLSIERGELTIGRTLIKLAPIEFCYYRYFAERIIKNKGLEKFDKYSFLGNFTNKIKDYHTESFPNLGAHQQTLEIIIKQMGGIGESTFRGNIRKLNNKLINSLKKKTILDAFKIISEGKRGAKFYGINADKSKIKILR